MLEYLSLLSFSEGGWGKVMLEGVRMTFSLAFSCIPFALPLGLIIALMLRSNSQTLRIFATIFSRIFRSLPELLTLFLVYYGLQIAVQKIMTNFNLPFSFSIDSFAAGIIALSLVAAAFSSEVWLGAFKVIDKGQYEAAKALSLSNQTTFFRVIFPQLIRNALPGLSNNWLVMLKDTSLVSSITLVDIMRQTNMAVAATKEPIFFYAVACILYLIFSSFSALIFKFLEKRANIAYKKVSI